MVPENPNQVGEYRRLSQFFRVEMNMDRRFLRNRKTQRMGRCQAGYVIFSDRSLIDMACRAPHDRAEFAEIHGVGATKLKDFAEPFLELIAHAMADEQEPP